MKFWKNYFRKSITLTVVHRKKYWSLVCLCFLIISSQITADAHQKRADKAPQISYNEKKSERLPSHAVPHGEMQENASFDILSYNVKMLGFPSNKKNKARAKQMISKLGGNKSEEDNFDVITIQELYTNTPQKILLQGPVSGLFNREGGLMNKYGYRDYAAKREFLVISNWPIVEKDWHKFNNNRGLRVRGVFYTKIRKQGSPFHVFTTHLWWDKRWKNAIGPDKCEGYVKDENVRVKQMREIDNFIDNKDIPDGEPIFIAGDFNFGGPGDSRYQNCKDKGYNVNSYREFKEIIDADQLLQKGGWQNNIRWPGTTGGTRTLDHIFHRNLNSFVENASYVGPQFFTTGMSLGNGFNHDGDNHLSDHDPVKGHFEFDWGWDLKEPTVSLSSEAKEWIGNYYGRNDGRRAQLQIQPKNDGSQLEIVFEDLDRNTKLTGTVYASDFNNSPDYIIKNLELSNGGCTTWSPEDLKCRKKTFERLFLHTWNENHISGFTEWSGTDYGVAFNEDGLSDKSTNRFNRNSWISDWTGTYIGREDGRITELIIERKDSQLHFTLNGIDRNKTFTTAVPIKDLDDSPRHIFKNLVLETDDGTKKQVERLYLHTWNTNYISGYTQWSGNDYGNYFIRSGN